MVTKFSICFLTKYRFFGELIRPDIAWQATM